MKVAVFKDFKDAADAAKADPQNVLNVIKNAMPAPEFYFLKYLPQDLRQLQSRDGLRKLRAILQKLKHIASPVERGFWFKELAKRTGVEEKTLEEESEKATTVELPARTAKEESVPKREVSRDELIFEELASIALAKNDFSFFDECADFLKPAQKEILRILKSGKRKSEDPGLDEVIGLIVLGAPDDMSEQALAVLRAEFKKEYYKERRRVLALAIRNAEARGDEAELGAALLELKNLPLTGE